MYEDPLISSALLVLKKALAPVADGSLQAWATSRKLGLNIEALQEELLCVMAIFESASRKQIGTPAMEMLLHRLQDSAHNAGILLEELDHFRIIVEVHCTNDGGVLKAVKSACLPGCWPAASRGESETEYVQDAKQQLWFNRIDFSQRMKDIVEKLQLMRNEITDILQCCGFRTIQDIAKSLPIIKPQIDEPGLYGRNDLVNRTIHDVAKVLTPLEAWSATNNPGLNIEPLILELLLVKATLETAGHRQIDGLQIHELLGKLRDSADTARNFLDELGNFRISDELHGVSDDNAHHNAKGSPDEPGQVKDASQHDSCCAWPGAQWVRGNSSSAPNVNLDDEEVSRCMCRLSKLLPWFSLPHVHEDDETPKQGFNRGDVSDRLKHIVQQLQLRRRHFTTVLQHSACFKFSDIEQSRPITDSLSVETRLYGRDDIMNSIIHDITKGQYCDKRLSVLPVIGPGGIGKTTLIQHIFHNQQVQNHFAVVIWICVSVKFNLDKVLEQIKRRTPQVETEKDGSTREELIQRRLKYKRFLLVLDDIRHFSNWDDWKILLSTLHQSEENGCMILVTTRFQAIAHKIKTTDHSIELNGLESEEFRKLFFEYAFGDEQCRRDHSFLLETGNKIIEKLKGSPLAAKTVGRLLWLDLSLSNWNKVLDRKEWEKQTDDNGILPSLKLSYDSLPFHLQQCFIYSALFPENFHFSSCQLINLWIGLDILQPGAQKQTFEDILGIGLSNLNDLVKHGFFIEKESNGRPCYVIHDLLYGLALKVSSHECLTLHHSNVWSVEFHPSIRHMSIILDSDNAASREEFKSELRELKMRLDVSQLQTLMIFGEMDEIFADILGDLFREVNGLRVLHLPEMSYPVESILHKFSTLVHLRYLFLGTRDRGLIHRGLCLGTEYESQMHLPLAISRFYDLRILDLGSWYGACDLPEDMSNLTKLCRFYTQKDELHSALCNVGKLEVLQELKVFRVNRESEGFEPKQLAHMTELSELGIYNLENIHTKEEGAEAKLSEKNYLEKLTLDWDSKRSNIEPDVEAIVLESLEPHAYLQELCIRGHGGPSCPTWLGDEITVKALQSLCLVGVSWEILPSVGKMWDLIKLVLKHVTTVKQFVIEPSFCGIIWFELVGLESFEKWIPSWDGPMLPLLQVLIIRDCPKLLELPLSNHMVYSPEQQWNKDWFPGLQELEIEKCPELLSLPPIPWTGTLCSVSIRGVMLLEKLIYSNSSHGVRLDIVGKDDLHSLDQVLAFSNLTELEELSLLKCPPVELKHLVMLTSLKTLTAESTDVLVEPLGGQGDVEWQLPVEHIEVQELRGNSGMELTEFLTHLPRFSKLEMTECGKVTHQLAVGVDLQQTRSAASEVEKDEIPPSSLFPKLFELLFMDEYKRQKCDKRDLERLSQELKSMQLVLCKVAEVPREQLNNQVRLWADNARELSYGIQKDVDDILVLMEEGKEFTKKMANLFKGKVRYQIAHTIRDIEKRMLEMPERRNIYRADNVAANLAFPPIRALYTHERDLIGIEHARNELTQIVCNGDNQLNILSVVGFGGLGKTALAKAVYDKLKMRFDCTAFVPVTRNPDMKKVLMQILYDLDKQTYLDDRTKDEKQLIYEIKNFLQTKRYLIVIDDLWDEDSWDIISLSLPSNDFGSRVLTTTRVNKIAEKYCSKHEDLIYNIMPLGYQNSKRLFLKKCLGSEDSCRGALTEVDEILKICGGIPLAIISIASAIFPFSAGKIKEQYQEMMKMKYVHSAPGELHCLEEFTSILSYKYSDLPNTLRHCLLYLGASAKNQRIQRDNLVRKWIAEGLVPEDKGCSREEVARQYFDELINMNVIQPVKYVQCLGEENYEVTYMTLYVLRLLSRKENFATFLSEAEPHVKVRPTRLFILCSDIELLVSAERVNLTTACSVTMLGPANSVSFKHLKNVLLLDLDGCRDLDNSDMDDICLLIKLKYLSLKHTQVTTLPPQIGKLQDLETLDVSRTQISNLPPEIGKLQSLITLDASKTQISNLPPEIRKLQSLETLDVRQTPVREIPKEVLQLSELAHLHFGKSGSVGVKLPLGSKQLKSVQVMGTVDSRECSESAMKEISKLVEIRELEVVLYDGPSDTEKNDKLLSSICKCSNLKSLIIYGDSKPCDKLPPESSNFPQLEKLKVAGRFVKVPGWIEQLSTLTTLVIRVCKLEANDLTIIGGLPCLSVLALELVAVPRKQVTITSSAGFARLEVFCFDCRVPWVRFREKAMPNLKKLQLQLYSEPRARDKFPSGIMLLELLNTVILVYSSKYASSDSVFEVVAVVRKDAASHANLIELSINGDTEIFPSNISADRCVAGTEFVNAGGEIEEV